MKRIIFIPIVIFGLLGLISALDEFSFRSGLDLNKTDKPALLVSKAFAAKKELKAGMIDPKTGKKIKYWVLIFLIKKMKL